MGAMVAALIAGMTVASRGDIGSQDGTDFMVMEHLEGETPAQRLARSALTLDQAMRRAIEIADALDKAHRQGIVDRELGGALHRYHAGPEDATPMDENVARASGPGRRMRAFKPRPQRLVVPRRAPASSRPRARR
jgi:aminoglycoside phosphotransferase (APT) family kinase protein